MINGDLIHSFRRRGDVFRKGNQFPFRVIELNAVVNFAKVLRSFRYSSTERSLSRRISLQESRQKNFSSAGKIPTDHVLRQRGYGQYIHADSDEIHLNAQSSEQSLLNSLQHTMSERKERKKIILKLSLER